MISGTCDPSSAEFAGSRRQASSRARSVVASTAAATTSNVYLSSQVFPAAVRPNNGKGSDRSSADCCAGANKAPHRESSLIDFVAVRHTSNAFSRLPTTSCSTPQVVRVTDLAPPAVVR